MRILFSIKALGAGPGGGAERILAKISSSLADRGHEVAVLTFDKPETEDFYVLGPNVARIRAGIGRTAARSGPLVTAARLHRVRHLARDFSPEVAVGFMHSSFTVLGMALLGTGIPVIGSERTSFPHYRSHKFDLAMLLLAQPFLAGMTVNGHGVRDGFPRFIRDRMAVIPNPVDKAPVHADPDGGRVKTLLCVGGLRPEKAHDTLIRAFARVRGHRPDWRIKIVGEGELRPRLTALVKELGREADVELAAATPSIEQEYRAAQLFVLPSVYEGFPNCLAEALAHGLAAVGFADCPGTNELIKTGANGILVSGPDRVGGLALALDQLMGSPARRRAMGASAVQSVAEYSLDRITDEWEDLLRSIASWERPTILSAGRQ